MIPALPATLAPPPPFPLVIAQSHETEFVAPGIRRAIYRLQTTDGPLVVTVVAVDPREPTVRFSSVLANDRLVSRGETVSSMAQRTGAVAGVNADYFDIGQTNQPLNVVVRDGVLLRTPSKRVALDVGTDRAIAFDNVSFSGSATYGGTSMPVTGVNEWPPQGGASLLTQAYGVPKPYPGTTLVQLVPIDEAHVATELGGTYRVVTDPAGSSPTGIALGFGPAARALGPLPGPNDVVRVDVATTPALDTIADAVGGGPLLVAQGAPADDPNAPAPEERDRRFPVSGAATTASGTLDLIAVDGRQPTLSIGVTRPQFAALMLGFGATSAMAFDSGGSATLVARVLGESEPSVLNTPSDGEERAVADGLFVYSDAPIGPPARLVVRPATIVALPLTAVTVSLAVVDAGGHLLATHGPSSAIVPGAAHSRIARLRSGAVTAEVPVEVVTHVARLAIAPDLRDPDPGAVVTFAADAFDARGRPIDVGDRVRWTSDRGGIGSSGSFVAPDRDARIAATVAGARAAWTLHVGHHRVALPAFDASLWHFDSAPAGAGGNVGFSTRAPEMSLHYDFTSGERAAYANANVAVPGEPRRFAVAIDGDGSGVGVRAAFVNVLGERRALTLARAVDWTGWRPVVIPLPDDLNPPIRLVSLYVVDSLASAPSHAAGSISFRDPSVVVAGTP